MSIAAVLILEQEGCSRIWVARVRSGDTSLADLCERRPQHLQYIVYNAGNYLPRVQTSADMRHML